MLGDSSFRVLFQALAYLYPGYLCYKDVQRTRTDKLSLWCKYWVLMAAFTAIQPIADMFLFFIPLYYSAKLAFAIYLWANELKGAELVYRRYVQPFVAAHEPTVDAKLAAARTMVADHMSVNMQRAAQWAKAQVVALLAQTHQAAASGLRADGTGQAAPAAERSTSFSSATSGSFGGVRSFSVKAE